MKLPRALLLLLALLLSPARAVEKAPVDVEVETQGLHVRITGVNPDAVAEVRSVVEQQASLVKDTTITAPFTDDLAFFLDQRYRQLGHPDVKVAWQIKDGLAIIDVSEGIHYDVGVVKCEGEFSLKEKEITSYLLRPTHERLGKKSGTIPFIAPDLSAGAGLVQRYFQSEGYLDAEVADPAFTPHPDTGRQDVTLTIKEGALHRFGTIQVTGERAEAAEEINALTAGLGGQPYSEVRIETVRTGITGALQAKGHYAALVTATPGVEKGSKDHIPVAYHLVPGPVFHFASATPDEALSSGARRILRSAFRPALGDVYSPSRLEFMNRRAMDTGVFTRLDVTPQPGEEGALELKLSGTEANRKTLGVYGGYETFQGPILGVELRDVNLFDSGDAMRVAAEYTGKGINGSLKWVDPAVFNSSWSFDSALSGQTFSVFDYERRTLGLRSGLSRSFTPHITAGLFATASLNDTAAAVLTPAELGPDSYRLATAGASLVFDFRDSPVIPTRGFMASFAFEGGFDAGGSDTTFLRMDIGLSYHRPLTEKLRVSAGWRASAIQGSGGVDSLPIDLRLSNGGATSVRSFPEREMGERSLSGTPLGGTLRHIINAELAYEIMPNLEIAAFADAGSLSRTDDNIFSVPDDFRFATGVGVRYKLPVGPLRIDYGVNPDRREGEPFGALHVTFGVAF